MSKPTEDPWVTELLKRKLGYDQVEAEEWDDDVAPPKAPPDGVTRPFVPEEGEASLAEGKRKVRV